MAWSSWGSSWGAPEGAGGNGSLVLIDGLECLVDQSPVEIQVDTSPVSVLVEQYEFIAEIEPI